MSPTRHPHFLVHVVSFRRGLIALLALWPALVFGQAGPAVSTIAAFNGSSVTATPVRGPDGALYGTTSAATFVTGGLIYRAAADGSEIETIYQLKLTDGYGPAAGLVLGSDGLLYGTTRTGSTTEATSTGTVFRIAPDGTGFTVLHRFANYTSANPSGNPVNTDGANPEAELVEGNDGYLYGVTRAGGPNGTGAVFKISRVGTGFDVLHTFGNLFRQITFSDTGITYTLTGFGGAEDSTVVADPTSSTNRVARVVKSTTAEPSAGTTVSTGANSSVDTIPFSDAGKRMTVRVYSPKAGIPVRLKVEDAADPARSVETEATATKVNEWETLIFDFANPATGTPALDLGYTYNKVSIYFDFGKGGAAGGDGTYYFDDVRFAGGGATAQPVNSDGIGPTGPLLAGADDYLYGTTTGGGGNGTGTLFRVRFDGTGFETLRALPLLVTDSTGVSRNADGAIPVAGLTDGEDGRYYGVASAGGSEGNGTLFAYDPVGRVFAVLHDLAGAEGIRPSSELLLGLDGRLYGTAVSGGTTSAGAVSTLGSIFVISRDGTGFARLHTFDGENGANPTGKPLQLDATTFVGVTTTGGRCGQGTLFQFSLTGATVDGIRNCGQKKNDGGGGLASGALLLIGMLGLLRRLSPR